METLAHTFPKRERLCNRPVIDALFTGGQSGFAFPIRYVYRVVSSFENRTIPCSNPPSITPLRTVTNSTTRPNSIIYNTVATHPAIDAPCSTNPTTGSVKILISVSKRLHKHAVTRNLLKRRMREACRLHKSLLTLPDNSELQLCLVYTAKSVLPYESLEHGIRKTFLTLQKQLETITDRPVVTADLDI